VFAVVRFRGYLQRVTDQKKTNGTMRVLGTRKYCSSEHAYTEKKPILPVRVLGTKKSYSSERAYA